MTIYLDEQPYQGEVDEASPLAEVIERIRETFEDSQRLVVGVRCDGNDITGPEFEAQMARPANTWERVDLATGRMHDMVVAAMTQALELLESADTLRLKIVEALTEGRNSEGMEALRTCMNHWQQIHQGIVHSLVMLNVDPAKEIIKGQPLMEWVKKPTDRLVQIKDSLQAQDYVMLSDTLQYEFDEVLDAWSVILHDLKDRAAKA